MEKRSHSSWGRGQRRAPGDHGGQHAMFVRLAAERGQPGVAQRFVSADIQEVVAQVRCIRHCVQQERKAQFVPLLENR